MCFILINLKKTSGQQPLRLCVPEALDEDCLSMRSAIGADKIKCVIARDRLQCMEKVQRQQADLVQVPVDDIYLAGKHFKLVAYIMEEINRSEYAYHPVAVVKRTSNIRSLRDLRMKNSCHTGMGRTAGYNVPIAALIFSRVMTPDCRGELYTVSRFFNSSCIPGSWTASSLLDDELKAQVPNLCALCKDPSSCDNSDEYAGYAGAMKCLTDGRGDVAFTKMEAVEEYIREDISRINQFDFLCPDGSRIRAEEGSRYPLCSWARKPSTVFMGAPDRADDMPSYHRTLKQILNNFKSPRPSWIEKVLVRSSSTTDLLAVPRGRQVYTDYLGNYTKSIERDLVNCQKKSVKLCVTSAVEEKKCQDLAMSAFTRRIRPELECVYESSHEDCIKSVSSRDSDIIVLDGSDVYRTGRDKHLRPLSREVYDDNQVSYYAVAVLKETSDIKHLSDLKGKHSCHTGLGQTSGWVVPVSALLKEKLLQTADRNCDRLGPVADFFGASCVPGANNTELIKNATVTDRLCHQCQGNEIGAYRCSNGREEMYSGQTGAFRCLVDNLGDVAFINHWTAIDLTRGRSNLLWARGLRSMDYKLLCRHGETAALQEYETCNMARVPAHYVMISTKASEEAQLDAALFLSKAAEAFGPKSTSHLFRLFGRYQGARDLIFMDRTTNLQAVAMNETYRSVLGDDFEGAMEVIDPVECREISSAISARFSYTLLTLLCVFNLWRRSSY